MNPAPLPSPVIARPVRATAIEGAVSATRLPATIAASEASPTLPGAEAVDCLARGELDGEVREEERRRQQPDRGQGHAVVRRQLVRDRADVRDAPRHAAAERNCRNGGRGRATPDQRPRRSSSPPAGRTPRPPARVLLLRVLDLGVREAAQALHEHHHRRHAGARDLGRVVQRAARQPVRRAGDLARSPRRKVDQLGVEQDRLDLPDPLPRDLDVSPRRRSARSPPRAAPASPRASRRRGGAGRAAARQSSTTVVTIPGFVDDAADRADRAAARALGDLADLERQLRRARERVAALGPSASSPRARPGRGR